MTENKFKRGSLTVEAAFILPLFIFFMLFFIFFIKILFIQENIQHAINETANEIAVYAYLYDNVQLKDIQQQTYMNLDNKSENWNSTIEQVLIQGESLSRNIDNVNITNNQTVTNANNIKLNMEGISDLKDNIESEFESIIININNIVDGLSGAFNNLDGWLSSGNRDTYEYALDTIGIGITKLIFKDYISDEELKSYGIERGLEGLNFRNSEYMLRDDDISIVVQYKVKLPFKLIYIDEINLTQRVTTRAWTGSNDSKHFERTNLVYIAKTSEDKYHTERYCYHIYKTVISEELLEIPSRSKFCSICTKEEDYNKLKPVVIVYSTGGDKYHIESNCRSIIREDVSAIDEKEAQAEGRSKCKNCD